MDSNFCLLCAKYITDFTKSINDTLFKNGPLIKSILNELNCDIPSENCLPNSLCLECSYKLLQLYNFRENCTNLLFAYQSNGNSYCGICFNNVSFKSFNDIFTFNDQSLSIGDIVSEVCACKFVDINCDYFFESICMQCFNSLLLVRSFYSQCIQVCSLWKKLIYEHVNPPDEFYESIHFIFKVNKTCEQYPINMKIDHKSKTRFLCGVCKESCASGRILIEHIRTHTNERPYMCNICYKLYSHKSNFKAHLENHEEKYLTCDICLKAFKRKAYLKKHLTTHSHTELFKCSLCSKTFTLKRYLNKHLHFVHKTSGTKTEETNFFTCTICLKTFNHKMYLKRHLDTVHSTNKSIKCHLCLKAFSHKYYLKKHLRNHTLKPTDKKLKKERNVKKKRVTEDSLKGDIESNPDASQMFQTQTGPFICQICFKEIGDRNNLKRHIQNHSKVKNFHCSVCFKSFATAEQINKHLEKHDEERLKNMRLNRETYKEYECSICCKSFHQKSRLISHFKMHTNEKPFQCIVCGKRFRLKHGLKGHLKSLHKIEINK